MIKVNILSNELYVTKVEITGHANYDIKGKDIVCSSASSIVITTVNGILSINNNYLKYENNNDLLTIEINSYNEIVNILINNMINLLKELETSYPNNLKIKEGENT